MKNKIRGYKNREGKERWKGEEERRGKEEEERYEGVK